MSDDFTPFALVTDDDAIIRMDAADILERAGFRVLEAQASMRHWRSWNDQPTISSCCLVTCRCHLENSMDSISPESARNAGPTLASWSRRE